MPQHVAAHGAVSMRNFPQHFECDQSHPLEQHAAVPHGKRPRGTQLLITCEEEAPVVEKVAGQEAGTVAVCSLLLPTSMLMHMHPLQPLWKVILPLLALSGDIILERMWYMYAASPHGAVQKCWEQKLGLYASMQR